MTTPLTTYRSDIEGIRAVAIGLVILYHAGVPLFGAGFVGVDVFFVLSGFLITGVMLRDIDRTGHLSLTDFWARRARRLLPAAFFALAAASLISWLWLPFTQREVFGKDIFSAAFYVLNWRLAGRSVDYLADDVWLSPVQHFWSLAVEEQFYIVWPLVVVAALLLARRIKTPSRAMLGIILSIAVAASLWWSVVQTAQEPTIAYLSTFTRFWEIGLGAGIALSARVFRELSDRPLAVAGWVGLAGVGISAVILAPPTPFPSAWALLPTVSAALVVISGLRKVPQSPYALLSTRPAVWLGGLSYSIYLWHWLALVAATAWWGSLSVWEGLAVVAASFVPAALIHRFIENPIRYGSAMKRPRNALSVGAVFAVASALCGVVLVGSVEPYQVAYTAVPGEGAASLGQTDIDWSSVDEVPSITPDPLSATYDVPDAYDEGCLLDPSETDPEICIYGADPAARTVMLVGDSKVVQWEPAMQIIAKRSGWELQVMAKGSCAFSEADQIRRGERYSACREWTKSALRVITDEQPDLVILSSVARRGFDQSEPESAGETQQAMIDGYVEMWQHLEALGIPVAVILDNPAPPDEVYPCVEQNQDSLSVCVFDVAPAIADSGAPTQLAAAAAPGAGVEIIDLTDLICQDQCPAVIGNVLVYAKGSHLTRTYVLSLEPPLAARLSEITGGLLRGT